MEIGGNVKGIARPILGIVWVGSVSSAEKLPSVVSLQPINAEPDRIIAKDRCNSFFNLLVLHSCVCVTVAQGYPVKAKPRRRYCMFTIRNAEMPGGTSAKGYSYFQTMTRR